MSRFHHDKEWHRIRASYLKEHILCEGCLAVGKTKVAKEVDHRIPLYNGGTHDEENLISYCHDCHMKKDRKERSLRGCGEDGIPYGLQQIKGKHPGKRVDIKDNTGNSRHDLLQLDMIGDGAKPRNDLKKRLLKWRSQEYPNSQLNKMRVHKRCTT